MDAADRPSQALLNAQKELERRRRLAGVSYQPARTASSDRVQPACFPLLEEVLLPAVENGAAAPKHTTETAVRVAPALAAWCLDRDHRYQGNTLDGPYRLYKILQVLDEEGRGWLSSSFIETTLTRKESHRYIYGRRQLKNMLRRGEGLFWQRVKSKRELRVRLRARVKIVSRLLNGRLRGQEVAFPLQHLLGSGRGRQAAVNAALYTAVHTGQIARKGKSGIISRTRLRDISGCSSYRQRRYERLMDIRVDSHIHILGLHSEYRLQQARLYEGLPAYKHIDYRGTINRHRRGAAYIARRLPNSYKPPDTFTIIHSRRQRTINRQLAGLCHMGSEGSGSDVYVRLFYESAALAIRSSNNDPLKPVFCPLSKSSKIQLWRSVA